MRLLPTRIVALLPPSFVWLRLACRQLWIAMPPNGCMLVVPPRTASLNHHPRIVRVRPQLRGATVAVLLFLVVAVAVAVVVAVAEVVVSLLVTRSGQPLRWTNTGR